MKSPSGYLLQRKGRRGLVTIYIGGVNEGAAGFRELKERPEVVLSCDAITSVNPTKNSHLYACGMRVKRIIYLLVI